MPRAFVGDHVSMWDAEGPNRAPRDLRVLLWLRTRFDTSVSKDETSLPCTGGSGRSDNQSMGE